MEKPEEAARRVFGRRAAFYTTSGTHADPTVLGRVTGLLGSSQDHTVLDVGTGTGHTAFAAAERTGHVAGIDLTREMLEEARRLQPDRQPNVSFSNADVHHLPFGAACFQGVTCRRAAHHFSDIQRALHEMRRVVRPGSTLVVDDRAAPEDTALDEVMNELDTFHDASHVREYRPSQWRGLLSGSGFDLNHLETYTQHRPLRSLTQGVSEMGVAGVLSTLGRLTPDQRRQLNYGEIAREIHFDHFYVLLSATAVAGA